MLRRKSRFSNVAKIVINFFCIAKKNCFVLFIFMLVLPASPNYMLRDFGFGTGGTGKSTDGSASLEAITGELSTDQLSGTNIKLGPGLIFTAQAHVPVVQTFDNPNGYYNKLRLIINPSDNPDNATFSVAISSDNFTTTSYVQSDNTIGAVRGIEDYKTYTNWGGASGVLVRGLAQDTTYQIKVNAMQTDLTETEYGPSSEASTSHPVISMACHDDETFTNDYIFMNPITGTGKSALDTRNDVRCNIITNNELGYSLRLISSTPELKDANNDTISAYTPAVTGNTEVWSVASVSSEWGARLKSTSTTYDQTKWGTAGTDSYAAKWYAVTDAGSFLMANSMIETTETGDNEVIRFGAEIGPSKFQPTGAYSASVTFTALTNE